MPIKEIIAITVAIVTTTSIVGGPWNLEKNLQTMKYTLLKELARTDNWGNPSPWRHIAPNGPDKHRVR